MQAAAHVSGPDAHPLAAWIDEQASPSGAMFAGLTPAAVQACGPMQPPALIPAVQCAVAALARIGAAQHAAAKALRRSLRERRRALCAALRGEGRGAGPGTVQLLGSLADVCGAQPGGPLDPDLLPALLPWALAPMDPADPGAKAGSWKARSAPLSSAQRCRLNAWRGLAAALEAATGPLQPPGACIHVPEAGASPDVLALRPHAGRVLRAAVGQLSGAPDPQTVPMLRCVRALLPLAVARPGLLIGSANAERQDGDVAETNGTAAAATFTATPVPSAAESAEHRAGVAALCDLIADLGVAACKALKGTSRRKAGLTAALVTTCLHPCLLAPATGLDASERERGVSGMGGRTTPASPWRAEDCFVPAACSTWCPSFPTTLVAMLWGPPGPRNPAGEPTIPPPPQLPCSLRCAGQLARRCCH